MGSGAGKAEVVKDGLLLRIGQGIVVLVDFVELVLDRHVAAVHLRRIFYQYGLEDLRAIQGVAYPFQ